MLKVQYKNDAERQTLLEKHSDMYLIEEQNVTEGNFLIFAEELPPAPVVYVNVPQGEFDNLKQETALLKAQSKALAERAAFTDDVIAEIAVEVYK